MSRSLPGVLILDQEGRLLWSNQEALEMLCLLQEGGGAAPVPPEVSRLCGELKDGARVAVSLFVREFGLDPVYYSLRAFPMQSPGDGGSRVMVLMEKVIKRRQIDLEKARQAFQLSKRETEVVRLICQGLGNKEISQAIFVSEHTVKGHVKKIMEKMGVGSRNEIVAALL